jgi:hypothetical protein
MNSRASPRRSLMPTPRTSITVTTCRRRDTEEGGARKVGLGEGSCAYWGYLRRHVRQASEGLSEGVLRAVSSAGYEWHERFGMEIWEDPHPGPHMVGRSTTRGTRGMNDPIQPIAP